MNENLWGGVFSVLTAIVGVALVAALVSPKAQTAGVLQAAGGAFSSSLGTALSPVGGSSSGGFGSFGGTGIVNTL